MIRLKHITTVIFLLFSVAVLAQNSDRDCIRMGNKYFRDKEYNKAETFYRKALDKNKSLEAYYNLANALLSQNNDSIAFEQYKKALEMPAETKEKKAAVYHNLGNMSYLMGRNLMKANSPDALKGFQQAVEMYKSALRCNPQDNETRYNLAMAQYMVKKNEQNQDQNQDQNQNQDKNQDQNKDNKDQNKDQNKDKQDQNKDQQDQQNKDKQDQDKQNQDKQNQDQQNQDKDKKDQQQQPQQPEEQKGQMDDKTAEQLLNSAQQDEKAVQKKVQKGERAHKSLDKDW